MNRLRRKFIKAAAAGGIVHAFGRTAGTVHAQMTGTGGFGDYKALVCLFLFGGNDSWNMIVPTSSAEYNAYARSRGAGTSSSLALLTVRPCFPSRSRARSRAIRHMGSIPVWKARANYFRPENSP